MKIKLDRHEPPTEPGLYIVEWGGSKMPIEAVYVSDVNNKAYIPGCYEPVDLNEAPYNHPNTRYSERIEKE